MLNQDSQRQMLINQIKIHKELVILQIRKNNWFNHNQKIKPWYPSSRVIEYIDTPSDALKIAEQDLKELLNGPPIMDI